MKIRVPSKTVEACDICRRESQCLTACVRCGKDYCHICEAIIMGCIHQPDLCKLCKDVAGVVTAIMKFSQPLRALLKKRDAAAKRVKS